MGYYVIGGDGQRYGPEDVPVLAQWAREGRLIRATVLIEAESGQRLTASQIPELARELGPAKVTVVAEPVSPPRFQTPPFGPPPPPYSPAGYPVELVSPKSRIAAGLLGIFLGGLGIHRFYLGYVGIGLVQLLMTFSVVLIPVAHIWGLIEGILCLVGNMRDAQGRPLRD